MNSVNEETYYFGQRELAWLTDSMKKDYIEAGSWDDKAKKSPTAFIVNLRLIHPLSVKR
ncbi:hypothetical protein [Arsenophonus endosymbiont of Aleurodicus floccissimus]|uniref:hypothetical protein n=1 Tax=Arsenophonus endosymbiont of Aleurodicus floccissimus TaxID=2152761 RepID=UPI001EE00FBD|nr:hypothetical protein [Arsenophonus endosymbiont of Aleurodicus floccissimus]